MVNRRYTLQKKNVCRGNVTLTCVCKRAIVCGVSTAGRLFSGGRRDISSSVYLGECSQKKIQACRKTESIKRQVREAYRVRKYDLIDPLTGKNKRMLVAFLYLDKEIHPFADMEKAMTKALNVLRDKA